MEPDTTADASADGDAAGGGAAAAGAAAAGAAATAAGAAAGAVSCSPSCGGAAEESEPELAVLALLALAGAAARPAAVPEIQFAGCCMRSNELARFTRAPEEAAGVGGRTAAARFLRSKDRARRSALSPLSESTRTGSAGAASAGPFCPSSLGLP